jgi:PAS domain S-box-containing protein
VNLRKRLVMLLGVFALYAVVAAAVTIYGHQWRIEASVWRFERIVSGATQLDRLQLLLTQQMVHLRDLVLGRADSLRSFTVAGEQFFRELRQSAAFSSDIMSGPEWKEILRLADVLEEKSAECLVRLNDKDQQGAQSVLTSSIEAELVPMLRTKLTSARSQLNELRAGSARELAATSSQIVTLTTLVAIFAIGLVVLGAMLMRRWVFRPLAELQAVARRLGQGDLTARVKPVLKDELGELGHALNEMARSVAASERKYRSLFSNLRDAVVICDADGTVIEYHDSDTRLLGVDEGVHVGRPVLDVWPEWRGAMNDWPTVIHATATQGRRFHALNVPLVATGTVAEGPFADFLVYHVDYGEKDYAAIVLRDVTDRQRLQLRLRRAETMEAVGTMAGGLAHDVNNLLVGVMGTLGTLADELKDGRFADRVRGALRACRRAAGLSRRLLNFASGAHGSPQVFSPSSIIETIIESMDDSFRDSLRIDTELDGNVLVRMDQDQFAQIVLNLITNARDAMPDGGTLTISLQPATAQSPDDPRLESSFALLRVTDTGGGMAPDVIGRVFEPFFTTKSRASGRGRGMGLTVVYTAVQNAGGFIQVHSEPGTGTTFNVYLPLHMSEVPAMAVPIPDKIKAE